MKAVIMTQPGGPEVLEVRNVPDPQPQGSQILVGVRAAALNRADLLQRRGHYPAPPGVPHNILGLEFAGVVEDQGRDARRFQRGDRVMGLLGGGGYAEKTVLDESLALPVPEDWSDQQAAAFPEAFFTAYDALFPQLGLKMGETILIHAVGSGVGTAALQLAKCAGATVLGTARSPEKLERARQMGLDEGIHCKSEDFGEAAARFTQGKGVNAVLDLVGADYWERNLNCLASQGRLILVGLLSGANAPVSLNQILRNRLHIMGTVLRNRSLWEKAQLTERIRRHVLPLARSGRIQPVVDCTFPLEDAAQAHQYMEENRNFGKIVLVV
ncbi:MAG: NAD(P)H-quinone oxidoreductase [Acidobacteriota bacterium]